MSDARATMVDVARRAGVSKSTVSLVLGGSSLVAESTRERVTDAMAELSYIYHRGAATLRGAKSGVLGMIINDLSNPFYVELAIGIEQACQGGAFIPFLANSAEDPIRQQEVIKSMREHGAAGRKYHGPELLQSGTESKTNRIAQGNDASHREGGRHPKCGQSCSRTGI